MWVQLVHDFNSYMVAYGAQRCKDYFGTKISFWPKMHLGPYGSELSICRLYIYLKCKCRVGPIIKLVICIAMYQSDKIGFSHMQN